MPSAAELRAELKALRKEHPDHKPVSRMKKHEVSDLIQAMKTKLEETPPVAAIASAPLKEYKSAVESVKKAKATEFPIAIKGVKAEKEKKEPKSLKAPAGKAKKSVVDAAVSESKVEAAAVKAGRPAKGSEEAKAKMAAIRASKMKSKD